MMTKEDEDFIESVFRKAAKRRLEDAANRIIVSETNGSDLEKLHERCDPGPRPDQSVPT
jgi:hypothetical protein